jgi:hypothetical protein
MPDIPANELNPLEVESIENMTNGGELTLLSYRLLY